MAKKNWISVCEDEYKVTNTEQITWESSSSEDELNNLNEEKSSSPVFPSFRRSHIYNHVNANNGSVESPVLRLRCCGSNCVSPELSERSSLRDRLPSPIILKRRLRLKKHKESKKYDKSPELFQFDSTQDIENESPTLSEANSQTTIKIEAFPSQYGSLVEADLREEANHYLYYQPPKRKKTYKKGSVAYQLQKILKMKKSRVIIWNHEKLKNINDDRFLENSEDIVCFKVNYSWIDYGVTLLECVRFIKTSSREGDKFLLSIGVSQILHIEFNKGDIYELYPPYNKDTIMYQETMVPYYYNTSKISRAII